ncbi:LacI family DNA-binding transcriptional regulator [Roseomonas sp. GCM10028921]
MAKRSNLPPAGPGDGRASRPATAYDVARLAGVSQSAVSRSFTEGASVSDATRRKVMEAAAALGYRPNLAARALITRRSGIIGVAVSYLENQFYPRVLEELSQALGQAGYRMLLFTAKRHESSDPVLEEVMRYRVDAILLLSASLSSHFDAECQRAGIPVILVNRRTDSPNVWGVTGDNNGGARTIAAFLAAGGHRRFAFMAGLEDASTSREREEGFARQLAAQKLPPPRRTVGHYDFEAASEATRALLRAEDRPDALFCANDHMALAAINVARAEFGLEVGRDLSIVGFDDAGPAAWPLFGLTTYVQPVDAMVEEVVTIVRRRLADPGMSAERRVVPGWLAVRGSARRPTHGLAARDGIEVWSPRAGN